MLGRLFFVFSMVTLLELAILIPLGQWMGLGPTILLVLGTGFLGAWLAKREGLRAWNRFQSEAQRGAVPTDPILDGLAIFTAALLLMTPGVLTDLVGFLLLIPVVRKPVKTYLRRRTRTIVSGQAAGFSFFEVRSGPGAASGPGFAGDATEQPRRTKSAPRVRDASYAGPSSDESTARPSNNASRPSTHSGVVSSGRIRDVSFNDPQQDDSAR